MRNGIRRGGARRIPNECLIHGFMDGLRTGWLEGQRPVSSQPGLKAQDSVAKKSQG